MAANKLTADIAGEICTAHTVEADQTIARLRAELAAERAKYKQALSKIDAERKRVESIEALAGIGKTKLRAGGKGKKTQASMVLLLSDWHVEERVKAEAVNGLNEFSLPIAERRIAELLERFLACLEHERQLAKIDRVVVWLGGDFISGHIHEDTAELAALPPLEAIRWAGERIRSVLDAIAAVSREVIVVTSAGNHGRSNPGRPRIGTELDHSFEQHLYLNMAAAERNKNVIWDVGFSHLHYLDLDGFKIRFHHGHAYKYQGGVGGIHVGVSKANAAWNQSVPADLTCFGHWHQFSWLRSGRYVSNGSLIGHSAYATRIKAAIEPPCQAAMVIDHKRREVTRAYPIFCDRDLALLRGKNA